MQGLYIVQDTTLLHVYQQQVLSVPQLTCSPGHCCCCDNSKRPAMVFERASPPLALVMLISMEKLHACVPDPLSNGQTDCKQNVALELVQQ